MNYLSLDEVVASACTTIGTSDKQDEVLMRQWAWEGLQDVGISEDSIEVCTLKPKNLIASKPDNCRVLIDINLFDSNGCQLQHVFRTGKKRIYKNLSYPQYIIGQDGKHIPIVIDVSEDRNNIILGSNGTGVTSIVVRYFSYPVDPNGLPMIREDERMAIVYYIRHMWALRKNDNRSEIDQNYRMWMLESDRARARKKNITNEEFKAIVKRWARLIPDFNYQRF